jgi:hypothetical protein
LPALNSSNTAIAPGVTVDLQLASTACFNIQLDTYDVAADFAFVFPDANAEVP